MSKTEVQAEAADSAGKKKGRLLVAVGVVVALAAGGVGAWWLLASGEKRGQAPVRALARTAPTFFTLEPFVVNLAGETQHYLQVGIDLKIADERVTEQIKAHLPEIRNGVLLLLSSKQVDELSSLEGKNRLRAEIRDAVNQPLGIGTAAAPLAPAPSAGGAGEAQAAPGTPAPAAEPLEEGVLEVLLTSFVIQ